MFYTRRDSAGVLEARSNNSACISLVFTFSLTDSSSALARMLKLSIGGYGPRLPISAAKPHTATKESANFIIADVWFTSKCAFHSQLGCSKGWNNEAASELEKQGVGELKKAGRRGRGCQ